VHVPPTRCDKEDNINKCKFNQSHVGDSSCRLLSLWILHLWATRFLFFIILAIGGHFPPFSLKKRKIL